MSDAAAVNAQLRRAVHLTELGRFGDAVPLVQRVLASEPGNVTALQVLANCLLHTDRFEEMLAVAEQAVALAPENPATLRQVAQALVGLGRARQGADAAREAHRLDPDDVRSALVLAQALLAAGGTADVLAAADAGARARHLAPEDPVVYLVDGDVQWRLGEFGRARTAYRQALSLQPDSTLALQRLAALETTRWRAHRALPALGDTVHAAPADPDTVNLASAGVSRILWLLTVGAGIPLLVTALLVGIWRDVVGGGTGVTGAVATVVVAIGGVVAYGRWRLRRLPHAARVLIRVNLRRRPVSTALLRPLSMAIGLLLFALSPRSGPGAILSAIGFGLILGPTLLLVRDTLALLTAEARALIRRLRFRLHRLRRGPV